MFKAIVISALVFFALVFCARSVMAQDKAAAVDGGVDWWEYGRADAGEISLALTLDQDLNVTIKIVNVSKRPLHILAHATGREGKMYNDRLYVTVNGQQIPYAGELFKIAMGKNWFETLEPGAFFSNTFDLRKYYPCNVKKGDVVRVEFGYIHEKASAEITL